MKPTLIGSLFVLLMTSVSSHATLLFPTSDALRDTNGDNIADEVASYASDYVMNAVDESRVFNEFDLSWLPLGGIVVESARLNFTVENYKAYSQVPDLSNFLQIRSYIGDDNISLSDWDASSSVVIDTFEIFEYTGPNSFEIINFSFDISDLVKDFVTNGKQNLGLVALDPIKHSIFDPPGLLRVLNMTISLNDEPVATPVSGSSLLALWFLSLALIVNRRRFF